MLGEAFYSSGLENTGHATLPGRLLLVLRVKFGSNIVISFKTSFRLE